jgi:hypothetical protein
MLAFIYKVDNENSKWLHEGQQWGEIELVLAIVTVSIASDICFLALSRWCLRKSLRLKNGWKVVSLVALNGSIGLLLILVPVAFIDIGGPISFAVAASNLTAGIVSVLFFLLSCLAFLHLALWPMLEKPLYSTQRFRIISQPKLLAGGAVTCLLFAWPHSPLTIFIGKLFHAE